MAAIPRAAVSEWPASRNEMAARIAPMVCPVRRAVASMPPAAPLRASGAAESIERLFGAWKNPNPRPHMAMRHAISAAVGFSGRPAKRGQTRTKDDQTRGAQHRRRKSVGEANLKQPTFAFAGHSRWFGAGPRANLFGHQPEALRRRCDGRLHCHSL